MNGARTPPGAAQLAAAPREAGADRVAEAWARLCESLVALAGDVESRLGARCPHRTGDDRCTFIGGCENQCRVGAAGTASDRICRGDHRLRWEPHSASHS